MKRILVSVALGFLLVISIAGLCSEPEFQIDAQLQELFDKAGITGTFVVFDVVDNRFVIHDKNRAEKRFIPASTFKIANSLIGLASGTVSSVDEVLPYGGKPQYLKSWEQDMGLREAIKISNVPVYRELARRIGLKRMSEYVNLLGYGNAEIGDKVDLFWLQGPLKISAIEQVKFLSRLAQDELPLPVGVQASVRNIVKVEQGDDWVLYAKTGWASSSEPAIGWWVGWVKKHDQIYSFALNIDMPDVGDAVKRKELGKASLIALGIIENGENNVTD